MDVESIAESGFSPLVRPTKLSSRLFGINWEKHFPITTPKGVQITVGSLRTCGAFFAKYGDLIFQTSPQSSNFLGHETSPAKLKYYEEVGDFFEFYHGSELIGFFLGTSMDWSSYYLRNCAILPPFQNQGTQQFLFKKLFSVLEEAGIERVEGEVSPSNRRNVHVLNKMGFHICGNRVSERWGALTIFNKFLSEKHRRVFLRQFCYGNSDDPKQSNT